MVNQILLLALDNAIGATILAALVLFAPWRWALAVASLATGFISVGGVLAPSFRHQLGDPNQTLTFAGSVTQVIGLVVALVFCAAAIRDALRRRPDLIARGPAG